MSDLMSEPLNQQHSDGNEPLPHDLDWAIMVSMYPEDFDQDDQDKATALLKNEAIAEPQQWSLTRLRDAQETPYTRKVTEPILSSSVRSNLLEIAERTQRHQQNQREASARLRFERWFNKFFAGGPALAWTAVFGLALIGIWSYQDLSSSLEAPLPDSASYISTSSDPLPAKNSPDLVKGQPSAVSAQDQDDSSSEQDISLETEAPKSDDSPTITYRGFSQDSPAPKRKDKRRPKYRKNFTRSSSSASKLPVSKPSAPTSARTTKKRRVESPVSASRLRGFVTMQSKALKPTPSRPQPAKSAEERASTSSKPLNLPSPKVQKVIMQHTHDLQRCQDLFDASILVHWQVSPEGRARNIEVEGYEFDSDLTQCVATQIQAWPFPSLSDTEFVSQRFSPPAPVAKPPATQPNIAY